MLGIVSSHTTTAAGAPASANSQSWVWNVSVMNNPRVRMPGVSAAGDAGCCV